MPFNSSTLVIGAASLDLKGHVTGLLYPGASNPGLVRRNVAENLARLGVDVALMTAIGDVVINLAQKEGLPCQPA